MAPQPAMPAGSFTPPGLVKIINLRIFYKGVEFVRRQDLQGRISWQWDISHQQAQKIHP